MRRWTPVAVLATALFCGALLPTATADYERRAYKTRPGSHRWEHWWMRDGELYLAALREGAVPLPSRVRSIVAGWRDPKPARRAPTEADEESIAVLRKALRDRTPAVRAAAYLALARSPAPQRVTWIQQARTREANDRVADAALLALGLAGASDAQDELASILRDAKEARRRRVHAALALGFLGRSETLATWLFTSDGKSRSRPAAQDPKQRHVALAAVAALSVTQTDRARDAIGTRLEDRTLNPHVRARVLSAAGRLGLEEIDDVLIRATHADDASIRRAAVATLGQVPLAKASAVVACLTKRLTTDEDPAVRGLAALSLGRVGGEAAHAALARAFEEADLRVRPYVSVALGLGGHTDFEARLRERLVEGSDPSRHAAHAMGIGLLGRALPERPASLDALSDVATHTGCPHQRGMTCLAMAMVEDEEAFATVRRLLRKTPDRMPRLHAAHALHLLDPARAEDELIRILRKDGNPTNRAQAARALGRLEIRGARRALMTAARSRGAADVRAAACFALGCLLERGGTPARIRLAFGHHERLDDDPLDALPAF